MHAAKRFFGIELIKIYQIGSNVFIFENRKKLLNHSTLQVSNATAASVSCSTAEIAALKAANSDINTAEKEIADEISNAQETLAGLDY